MKCARLLLFAVAACASAPAVKPHADFAGFVDEFFAARFAFNPSGGTQAGLHQYDDALEDRSRARIDARVAELRAEKARLAELSRGLGFAEGIDAQLIGNSIDAELLRLEVTRVWELN